ncbi:recombinase family protein [Allokutzneria multivorans]
MIGYARVSTRDQHDESQVDLLEAAGCERIFTDKVSGKLASRPQWDKCLDYLRPGDTLVVTRLSRIARSVRNLTEVTAWLADREIDLVVLKQHIDTRTPAGRLTFHILGAVDEFTADLISEGTVEGLEAARARGRKGGRPAKITAAKLATARKLYAETDDDGKRAHTVAEIAEVIGVSRATLYRHLTAPTLAEPSVGSPDSDKPQCAECGKGTKARREHPVRGEGWFCATCVSKAKDRQYKAEAHKRKLDRMTPEERAQYDKYRAAAEQDAQRKRAGWEALRAMQADGKSVRL